MDNFLQAQRYLRYLQLTHPFERSIINCFELATVRRLLTDEDNPVVYLYSDAMGVLQFHNVIYGGEEERESGGGIVMIDLEDSLFEGGGGEIAEVEVVDSEDSTVELDSDNEPFNPSDL